MMRDIKRSTWVFGFLVATTLGFGVWGWNAQANNLDLNVGDILFRAFSSLILSDVYGTSAAWGNDWRIEIARWSGVGAFILGATKAIFALLAEQMRQVFARFYRDHILIVGDAHFATALALGARALGKAVIWLAASQRQTEHNTKNLLVLNDPWHKNQVKKFGFHKASSIIIATNDDAANIAAARAVQTLVAGETVPRIFTMVSAPWLANRIDEVDGVAGINLFSPARAAARRVHVSHPPFLVAQNNHHTRIHAVIIGFGLYGEAVLMDLLLSCLTTYLGKPMVTIIDPRAEAIKTSLALRYPELCESIELFFVCNTFEGAEQELSETTLHNIAKDSPVTLTYICLPKEAEALAAGLAIQSFAHTHTWTHGPIFVRLSYGDTLSRTKVGTAHLKPAQLIGFGAYEDLADYTGVLCDKADGLAKTMHAAYCATAPNDSTSNVSWKALGEDMRDANRRFVVHIPAKLSSAGIDVEDWLAQTKVPAGPAALPCVSAEVFEDPALCEKLAVLEHERWMADRRINGWRYGKARNNIKRFHPDLVAFERLSEQSQAYDRTMVKTLVQALTRP